ncbi:hypothetical protein [Hyphomicrobium sp.]|uniref:hypothetical protein n=1 Tax=Hyphomicrobium sp. TaxID=82 RepID=UPI00356A72E6
MRNKEHAQALLASRIIDLKRRIAEAQERPQLDGRPWDRSAGLQILELLKSTLKDLEARLAVLQNADKK